MLLRDPGAFLATADRDGHFVFSVPFVGRYAVTARDTTYAAFGVVRAQKPMFIDADTTGSSRPVVIALDPAIDAARVACEQNSVGRGTGVLLVRLLQASPDGNEQPVAARWQVRNGANEREISFQTSASHIAICGISGGTVTVDASDAKGRTGRAQVQSSGKAVIDTVTITVDRKGHGPG